MRGKKKEKIANREKREIRGRESFGFRKRVEI